MPAISEGLRRMAATGISFCWLVSAGTAAADPQCGYVAGRGHLNVLTINLLFSEVERRDQRLADIAAFMAADEIDVALLQEVVGGALVDTDDSARDLQEILRDREGLDYELRTEFEARIPGVLAVGNAILSRCDIRTGLVKRLPRASEIEFEGQTIELPRNVMMARLTVPGIAGPDRINVYNTHLCAGCQVSERQEQLDELLAFVEEVEDFFPATDPVILGGDFNIDRFRDGKAERPLYKDILKAGFNDAYAAAQAEPVNHLCNRPTATDPDKLRHCTVSVSELDGNNARRIDYVFERGFAGTLESRVVFNTLVDPTQPTVSDHAAVAVRLSLP
jgi:maltose 6'-phosphate phosphatase